MFPLRPITPFLSLRSFLPSGLSTKGFSAASVAQERARRIVPLERLSEASRDTLSALTGLDTRAQAVRTAAQALQSNGGAGVDMVATSSDSGVVTGSASPAAPTGSISVTVTALAQGSTFSFAGVEGAWTSTEDALSGKIIEANPPKSRTVTFSIGSGDTAEAVGIVLSSETTISQFVSDFNAVSSQAEAELVNRGTTANPDYAISIRSTNIGETLGYLDVSPGEALTDPNGDGERSDDIFREAVLTQATNAAFSVSGVVGTLTRESNTVSDVISGLTLTLAGVGSATVTVSPDSAGAASRVKTLVDSFNDLVTFRRERNGFSYTPASLGGGVVPGALRQTGVDELLVETLRSDLRGLSGSGGLAASVLGISTNRDGTLNFDEETFRGAVENDPAGANTTTVALAGRIGAVGGTVDRFDGSTGLIASSRGRVENQLERYEASIATLERRIGEREARLNERYARVEGTLARLSSQSEVLGLLLNSPGRGSPFGLP